MNINYSGETPLIEIRWPATANVFSIGIMLAGVFMLLNFSLFGKGEFVVPTGLAEVFYGSLSIGAIILLCSYQKIDVYADRVENSYFGFRREIELKFSRVRVEKKW